MQEILASPTRVYPSSHSYSTTSVLNIPFSIYVKRPCLISGGELQPSMVKEREEISVVVVF